MELADELRVLLARLHAVEVQMVDLADRVSVLEERTIDHESRLEDCEAVIDEDQE